MNIALLPVLLLGSNLALPVSDRVPSLQVEALCKATTETDKGMGLALPQSYADCMRDEESARTQLTTIWPATAIGLRDNCEGEATVGGNQSYVDLLTCIQMTDIANGLTKKQNLRGASRNRNAT